MPLLPYKQSICQCQVQELKKEMNGRGRHLEQKIRFLTINQVQPTLFLKKLSLIKVKEELVTETNEDNDFTTMIPIGIILCFIEHLYYPLSQLKYLAIVSFFWNDN